jgi:hypothetical protein
MPPELVEGKLLGPDHGVRPIAILKATGKHGSPAQLREISWSAATEFAGHPKSSIELE